MDGDGDVDLVMANGSYQVNQVHLNTAGVFSSGTNVDATNNLTQDAALGDIDGDGDLGLIEVALGGPNADLFGQRQRRRLRRV